MVCKTGRHFLVYHFPWVCMAQRGCINQACCVEYVLCATMRANENVWFVPMILSMHICILSRHGKGLNRYLCFPPTWDLVLIMST